MFLSKNLLILVRELRLFFSLSYVEISQDAKLMEVFCMSTKEMTLQIVYKVCLLIINVDFNKKFLSTNISVSIKLILKFLNQS